MLWDIVGTQTVKVGIDLSSNLALFIDKVADLVSSELESLMSFIARDIEKGEKFMNLEFFYEKVFLWMKAIWDAKNP